MAECAYASDPVVLDAEQVAVLALLARGLSDRAVAAELDISERTLRRRLAGAMDALGARTRFQAAALAAKHGWI
jgi:DNA-binding NarL/FixJ family response regulator